MQRFLPNMVRLNCFCQHQVLALMWNKLGEQQRQLCCFSSFNLRVGKMLLHLVLTTRDPKHRLVDSFRTPSSPPYLPISLSLSLSLPITLSLSLSLSLSLPPSLPRSPSLPLSVSASPSLQMWYYNLCGLYCNVLYALLF